MCTIVEVLSNNPEPYPNWLQNTPTPFNRDRFFSSRNVVYPGSGDDGQPVKFCAQAHAAHTFVYADYGEDRETIEEWLHHPQHRFRGYTIIHVEELTESDLVPEGWIPNINYAQIPYYQNSNNEQFVPFEFYVVFEREDGYDERHGPERIAGLFIGGEGFATFDKLYCQKYEVADPYLILIQDYGCSCVNIPGQKFGRGGLLETLAEECDKRPTWLLVGEDSIPWCGYDDTGAVPEPGGMGPYPRSLFGIRSNEFYQRKN